MPACMPASIRTDTYTNIDLLVQSAPSFPAGHSQTDVPDAPGHTAAATVQDPLTVLSAVHSPPRALPMVAVETEDVSYVFSIHYVSSKGRFELCMCQMM